MKRKLLIAMFAAAALVAAFRPATAGEAGATTPGTAAETSVPLVQVALLLDTSNSMDGLIDQAKSQLWKVVNEFAAAKRDGSRARLQVALYEYGNDNLAAEGGHIRMVLPLTTDLDRVSEELFRLKTNGGSEYCGRVVGAAVKDLDWSASRRDIKAIFIAGNEPFTQGAVDYRVSCKEAISRGITVSTIFCGPLEEGVETDWKSGAVLADGDYMNIDHNRAVVSISAPQDAQIERLGVELNATYIPFGAAGSASLARQHEQDKNAVAYSSAGAFVQRAVSKSSYQYTNASWDLVDALADGTVKLDELKPEDLPEEMKTMSAGERKAYAEKKAADRKALQEKIRRLNADRETHVAAEMKKRVEAGEDTFDAGVARALARQAEQKGFDLTAGQDAPGARP